jgi:peptide/nickel transport system substrate-binding protein
VVFSFNRLKNIKGNPSSLAINIKSVEAPDDSTVVLTLENPDPSILAQLVNSPFSVTNSEAIKKQGGVDSETADKDDKAEQWLNQHAEGSGPYLIEKWEPKVETILVRNPTYWGPAPAIERVVIRNVPDAATQKLQLEAGEADIALDLTADQLPSLEGNDKVSVYQARGDVVFFLLMNADQALGGPMSDPKVQQAVRMAVDYEGIKALIGGKAATPASIIPIGFIGAYEEDKALKRDVEGAKKLLEEAGQGAGFTVDLTYPDFTNSGVNFATLAQKVQADLAEVGITANLKGQEVGVWLDAYRQGQLPFTLSLWGPDFRDPGNYLEFLPEKKVGLRANWKNDNSNADIQDLRDKALVATDPATRVELFGQIQDYLQQNGPWAPLVQNSTQIGLNSALKGFVFNPQWRVDVALLSK